MDRVLVIAFISIGFMWASGYMWGLGHPFIGLGLFVLSVYCGTKVSRRK